jgi:hypothetical protein
MSNPLLRPNDPRFAKPSIQDEAGKNRFGDDQPAAGPAEGGELFAAAASEEPRPYVPKYEAQQAPRTRLLTLLAAIGWGCGLGGAISLTGWLMMGWLLPLLGIGFAMTAWQLAYQDLKAIESGAIDASARPRTRHAFWLGLLGLLICLSVVAAMLWRQMALLPDFL